MYSLGILAEYLKKKGRKEKLKELVQKKLAKGKSLEEIASELEETVESIQEICDNL